MCCPLVALPLVTPSRKLLATCSSPLENLEAEQLSEKSNDVQSRDMATQHKVASRKIPQLDSSFSL